MLSSKAEQSMAKWHWMVALNALVHPCVHGLGDMGAFCISYCSCSIVLMADVWFLHPLHNSGTSRGGMKGLLEERLWVIRAVRAKAFGHRPHQGETKPLSLLTTSECILLHVI